MPELPIVVKDSMKCPHCLENFHAKWEQQRLGEDKLTSWSVCTTQCPACTEYIFVLRRSILEMRGNRSERVDIDILAWPRVPARARRSVDVSARFADDYKEACLVLTDSPKASAALSRRCLQNLLREAARVKPGDLANEIQQVLDAKSLPSQLAEAIDAVRVIGNFAAHPMKSERTGEIIGVEPGEAEWLLDTLEGLFDFYFVQPAILKRKKEALNKKLSETGKPPVK